MRILSVHRVLMVLTIFIFEIFKVKIWVLEQCIRDRPVI